MEKTPIVNFLGLSFNLNTLLAMLIVILIVLGFCFWTSHNLSVDRPTKAQVMMESIIEFVEGICDSTLGQHKPQYVVLGMTFLLFIFVANMIGLPFLIKSHEYSYWRSPTADPIVTVTLAVISILSGHLMGIKKMGLLGHIKNFYLTPNLVKLPIQVVEETINTTTLALRLFGNIFAGEILLGLIAGFAMAFTPVTWPLALPLQFAWQGFSVFIGAIQAYIFTTLTMVYLSHKIEKN
ncbi:F0F1 ATP synthase subunit A [Facklamia hominis]|uniref:ATP synthase subunit a n=2 Tax=Facklamia hominis TaxID=178214 RepID=K1LNH4_9LACT|nr:F0F1 ATP synthase subunit A [Facklamia hominis]EKB56271.1 ATP synthase F0, A subunit [Facklamia hominis CCUG 36813]EPH12685.1 ATP synthase F0, A subunit [Facklamia hominis ACS-120-V-Sch10]MDK7186428.1 F0F1 ATP synthase subunit A [Facklamia hominis]WPJ91702.1 F0F1 ATP synthase subunit A [Facklamia hominis]